MSLQTRLAGMSDRFKQVLEQRSTTLQAQAARKNQFSAGRPIPANKGFENPAFQFDKESSRSAIVPSLLLQVRIFI